MGSHIDDWAMAEGPIYMGADSSWEVTWLLISVALCVVALIAGSMHEKSSYRKLRK